MPTPGLARPGPDRIGAGPGPAGPKRGRAGRAGQIWAEPWPGRAGPGRARLGQIGSGRASVGWAGLGWPDTNEVQMSAFALIANYLLTSC